MGWSRHGRAWERGRSLPRLSNSTHWPASPGYRHLRFIKKPMEASYRDLFRHSNTQGRIAFWMFSWRVVALSQNYTVRLLDASAWTGMAVGGLAMVVAGGPAASLSSGVWGVLQTLTLASSVGSVAAMVGLCATAPNKGNDE